MNPDRVDRLIAWLEEHRAELTALETGSVRFDFHGNDVRVDLHRSTRLPRSGTLAADGPSAHSAVAS